LPDSNRCLSLGNGDRPLSRALATRGARPPRGCYELAHEPQAGSGLHRCGSGRRSTVWRIVPSDPLDDAPFQPDESGRAGNWRLYAAAYRHRSFVPGRQLDAATHFLAGVPLGWSFPWLQASSRTVERVSHGRGQFGGWAAGATRTAARRWGKQAGRVLFPGQRSGARILALLRQRRVGQTLRPQWPITQIGEYFGIIRAAVFWRTAPA
jgi:hypothetical protein